MAKVLIGNFKGPKGDKGDKGNPGTAATIQVGTTQTVQPESNAEVTNTGTTSAAVLNFKIPRGEDGMTDLTAEYKDASEYTCQPTVNAPVVLKEIDGKTEQGENPSPDNPQAIKGVGGMGYFDGEWKQGVYQAANGTWQAAGNGICSQNPINAKAGDNVTLKYPDEAALVILAYKNDGTYLGNNAAQNANEVSYTLPTNTAYVHIDVQLAQGTSITPSTAKYCTVTINGEYATGLETQGRNLAEVTSTLKTQTYAGVTINLNDDGSYSLNGTCTETSVFRLNQPTSGDIPNYPVICKLKAGTKYRITGSQIFIRNSTYPVGSSASTNAMKNDVFYTPTEDTYVIGIRAHIAAGTTYSSTKTYYPGIWEDPDETRTEWAPFKRTSITIPLTAPLYEGDKICYVKPGDKYVNAEGDTVVADGVLYGAYRENAVVVFDGSEDEGWVYNNQYFYSSKLYELMKIDRTESQSYFCNLLKCVIEPESILNYNYSFGVRTGFIAINNTDFNNINDFKSWLSENPREVVYRLAQPYFEPFTDQSIFYTLRTDDTLSYVYSSDPINPNVTVEVAKNSTGGYLLESYAQAQKNALSEADNASRLAAVEQQLLTLNTTVSTMGGGQ